MRRQLLMQRSDCFVGQFLKLGSYGQDSVPCAPGLAESHFRFHSQPSSPMPEFPSKKQSCLQASMLSPGMPVAKVPSSLSQGPEHSGSRLSIRPSLSLSIPSVHCEGLVGQPKVADPPS